MSKLSNFIEKFSDMEAYGFNIITKEYTKFAKWLTLSCHMEHGWTLLDEFLRSDLETEKPLMLVMNKRRAEAWKRKSKIPVAIVGIPFIHFRRERGITQKSNARGTIAFPFHSTKNIGAVFDIKKYCAELNKIPNEFKLVSICLIYHDIKKEFDKKFQAEGFEVVTTGNRLGRSLDFV